jgi:hypothetical protein
MRYRLGPVWLVLLSLPAGAAELVSDYSKHSINNCTMLESDEFGQVAACPGLKGYPVMIIEGDMKLFVSYGFNAAFEKAAKQTLPTISNRIDHTMEWLLPADDFTAPPIAAILRWRTQVAQAAPEGEVLVVTQLVLGATCQIAWIDALANENANELARQAAEDLAGDFDCDNTMPKIYGEFTAFDLE